tara:strand:- start:1007 stop:1432 length:426 start_codon:yes stop_codon:yes gene_type:complete
MRPFVEGQDDVGDKKFFTTLLPIGKASEGKTRLEALGLGLLIDGDKVVIDNAVLDSIAQKAGLDFDQVIENVLVPASKPAKQLLYISALILLVLIALLQRRRERVAVAVNPQEQERTKCKKTSCWPSTSPVMRAGRNRSRP